MHNKTEVFDVQKEIAELKRRVQQLENEKAYSGQPLRVTDDVYNSPWSDEYKGPNGFFNDPNRPFP